MRGKGAGSRAGGDAAEAGTQGCCGDRAAGEPCRDRAQTESRPGEATRVLVRRSCGVLGCQAFIPYGGGVGNGGNGSPVKMW